jgi:hypothetical protein
VSRERYVITAGHCLPRLPISGCDWDTTYPNLLAPLGGRCLAPLEFLLLDRFVVSRPAQLKRGRLFEADALTERVGMPMRQLSGRSAAASIGAIPSIRR